MKTDELIRELERLRKENEDLNLSVVPAEQQQLPVYEPTEEDEEDFEFDKEFEKALEKEDVGPRKHRLQVNPDNEEQEFVEYFTEKDEERLDELLNNQVTSPSPHSPREPAWQYYGYDSPEEFEFARTKKGADMSWEKSDVMSEYMKIALDQGLLKNAYPPNPYQEDLKTIEEKRQPAPEKSIIEEAHPEPVYTAEGRGEGGLVENEIENQKKWVEMVNKMPTGSLVGRYAHSLSELVKLANHADELGEHEAADHLTYAASVMLDRIAQLPLV